MIQSEDGEAESRETLIFLPGASGNTEAWRPLADLLSHPGRREFVAWPGFGKAPPHPDVNGIDDLVDRVAERVTRPTVLFAQSMGGVIALRVALLRPGAVHALVLSVTSGGLDIAALGGIDWRPWFRRAHPGAPRWFVDEHADLSGRFSEIRIPTLLLFGDADPISPVAVGERLAASLPMAELVVVPGGTHDLVTERAGEILPHVERHLARVPSPSGKPR